MVLNSDVADCFGTILTGIFAAAADGKENSPFYSDVEDEYLNIIAEIKGRKPCDMTLYRKMIFKYDMQIFTMITNAYRLDEMIEIIKENATPEELRFCKDTLKQFILDAAIIFERPDISIGLSPLINSFLNRCGLVDATVEVPTTNNNFINIKLDNSVKSISRTAAYHLSSVIANGAILSQNNDVIIYKDHIDFGRCNNPEYQGVSGNISPNFYMEYGNVIYRFGSNLKCGWFSKQIEYCGIMPPTSPDNLEIFNLIYPRFS